MRRATWVWDRPTPRDLVPWARAHDVGQLFLGVRPDVADAADLRWMRSAVDLAHREGIRVAALGGDKSWVENHASALVWLRAVLDVGFFDGVHLDVEVWDHHDWRARPVELGAAYLALLGGLRAACPLPLEADLAFHLHEVPAGSRESLETAVMRVVDAVTVLSYRNTVSGPDSITEVAASALSAAAKVGVPCRLAVETRDLGPSPVARKQTFHGLGRPALHRALDEVDRTLTSSMSYAGMAVHDHASWRAL